jgi:dUTP pyrophosphatase
MIEFIKLNEEALTPRLATKGSAGFDLYCDGFYTIKPNVYCALNTGITVVIPDGYCGQIMPRSGLAVKYGIDTLAGLIDSDYRGEIKVALINHGTETVEFKKGDRIAQIVFQPILTDWKESKEFDDTERGAGGFGSTGK